MSSKKNIKPNARRLTKEEIKALNKKLDNAKEIIIRFYVKDTKDDNNNYHSSSSNILPNN